MTTILLFIAFLAQLMSWLIIARSLLSWFPDTRSHPVVDLLHQITDPVIVPIQRIVPRMGMFDLSPMIAFIVRFDPRRDHPPLVNTRIAESLSNPDSSTTLLRDLIPETMRTALLRIPNRPARSTMSALFAWPSTGDSRTLTRSLPAESTPTTSALDERGCRLMSRRHFSAGMSWRFESRRRAHHGCAIAPPST